MRTLLIDNYDSFTYNLYQLIGTVNGQPPVVIYNDTDWQSIDLSNFDNIVVSPGPGRPDRHRDMGISIRAIRDSPLPLLGVCLGHQGICDVMGGRVGPAPEPIHGRSSKIFHTGSDIFAGIPSPFSAVRYHSLAAVDIPDTLQRTAWTSDQVVMGLRHRTRPLWGVQFHPESICSEGGVRILSNFRDLTKAGERSGRPERVTIHTRRDVGIQGSDSLFPSKKASQYQCVARRVTAYPDTELAYSTLFSSSYRSFWLDTSDTKRKDSRFSIIGDAEGPLAEYITYDVSTQMVAVRDSSGAIAHLQQPFFEYLDKQLRFRCVEAPADVPCEFNLGYVGYLGYELKSQTGGQPVHQANTPDAALIFADRVIVVDHVDKCCYLLFLVTEDTTVRETMESWFISTQSHLITLSSIHNDKNVPETPTQILREGDLRSRHNRDQYLKCIDICKEEIRQGESYEVCLTNMVSVRASVDPWNTYRRLRRISPVPYGAFLDFRDVTVLSASPERFVSITAAGHVESKPIKGTRPRGSTPEHDKHLWNSLYFSEKDRSENLMIIDLVRHDLNKVCILGSVHVPHLFAIETFTTVHQMVSTIRGTLPPEISSVECVKAAFPGGSMTGAPKIRTMEIIDQLENGPRGVYSGALGWFALSGAVDLSIVIRTIVMSGKTVTFGVGGAIVALSDRQEEYEETLIKAAATIRAITPTTTPSR